VISGSVDTTVKVWHLATGKELLQLKGHKGTVRSLCVTADGTKVISGSSDCQIMVWNLTTGEKLFTLSGHTGRVRGLAVTSDSQYLISASEDCTLKIWDLHQQMAIATVRGADAFWCCALALDSQIIAVGDYSGQVYCGKLADLIS
jgi:WD40 repeat protein